MKNIKWSILGVLAAATLLAACDPYKSQGTAAPTVVMVTQTDPPSGTYTAGTPSGSGWLVADVPSTCDGTTGAVTSDEPVLFATSNQLLDGASIQSSTTDCTPAGSWLTVTPAAPAGETWYSCFQPGSPSPDLGSAVVMFLAASGGVSGWDVASLPPASNEVVTTYTYTGSVKDWQGQAMPIDVTVTVDPNAGIPGDPTMSSITDTSVVVSWTAGGCEIPGTTTYVLERAPDVSGAPGNWAVIAGPTASMVTYTDNAITTGNDFWYRVTSRTSTGYSSPSSAAVDLAPPVVSAPTFTAVTATTLTVNWTTVVNAVSYTVQRAPDNFGVPGTWADIATGQAGPTYNDTGLVSLTKYWYRIVAVGLHASSTGASASVTTP